MRLFLYIFPFVILISSCNKENKAHNSSIKDSVLISDTNLVLEINKDKSIIDSSETGLLFSPTGSYANTKSKINNKRLQYYNELTTTEGYLKRDSIINDARDYFTKTLLNQICHVGYIYVKNNELYFLHSNYIDGYVMIEKAEYSDAFKSNIYVIADITFNRSLIVKWIDSSVVQVVTD